MKKVWIATGIIVALALGYGYWHSQQPVADTTVAVESKPAAAVARTKRVSTPVKSVQTYEPRAKADLKLPAAIIADADKQVTSATTIPPSERRVTVTSVVDVQTGETKTYQKPEPYPWIAVESRGEARLDLGYKIDRRTLVPAVVGRLTVTHSFLQLKALHAGVNVAVDTDGTAFAGVGLSYRW